MLSDTELRTLLAPLDPAAGRRLDPRPTSTRERELANLLAAADGNEPAVPDADLSHTDTRRDRRPITPAATRSRARIGRTAVMAGLAVAVGATVVIAVFPGTSTSTATAATPTTLTFTGPKADGGVSDAGVAAGELDSLASVAASQPPIAAGQYAHLVSTGWSLNSVIDGTRVTSAVVAKTTETWTAMDGSGRLRESWEAPTFTTGADRTAWERAGAPTGPSAPVVTTFGVGQMAASLPGQAPTDPEALAQWLTTNHPVSNGPAETLIAVEDLLKEQVLEPNQRGAVLQVLAAVPGLRYRGSGTDRAGQAVKAFTVNSSYSGLPTDYTVLDDVNTGRITGSEEVLTTSAGRLNVAVPATISYETYRTADYVDH